MLRLNIHGILLLLLILGPTAHVSAQAGMPELVGVLQLVLEDETAKQLELSDSQREAIQKLVDQRETAGLSEVLKVKDASPEERAAALAPFRDESVRQGLKVLSDEQRAKLSAMEPTQTNPLYALPAAGSAAPTSAQPESTPKGTPSNDPPRREFGSRSDRGGSRFGDRRGSSDRGDNEGSQRSPANIGIPADADGNLTFSFRYQDWAEVIDWFAKQADLSLIMDSPPQGTFNYTNSRKYTPAEALDVLNSVLLTKGYTLVRKDRMLFVINLEDEIPPNLVTDVSLNELDQRGEYELVRTLFQVRTMTAAEAAAEIEKLIGPQGNVVILDRAGMIQVTETAGRLRTIRSVISAVEGPSIGVNESPQLEVYTISGADPAAVLAVLQTLMAEQKGVRLATDPQTGNLIALARPSEHFTIRATIAQMQQDARRIEVIPLRNVDPQTAVLAINKLFKQTEGDAADPSAPKVDADLGTRTLLVRASPSQLTQIEALLEKMGESGRGGGGGYGDYASSGGNVRLIPLSGSAAQTAITQIERIWPALRPNPIRIVNQHAEIPEYRPSDSGASLDGPDWRRQLLEMLPSEYQPRESDSSATPAAPVTPRGASQPATRPQSLPRERTTQHSPNRVRATFAQLQQPEASSEGLTENSSQSDFSTTDEVERQASKAGAPIIIAPGPGGTMIASEDIEALDELERLLSASAPVGSSSREYAVFYLKYAKAAAAAEILGRIFGTSSSGGGGGSLMGDIAGAALGDVGGGLVGDLLGLNGTSSSSGFLSGTVEIVPDVRLNALIVNARPTELDMIDRLLRILDQRSGPETVEAGGTPRLIPVLHMQATQVAEIVRQVFQDRLQSAGGQGGQPSPEDILRMLGRGRGGPGGGGGGGEAEKIEKMTIGVDERNNALVVRASDPLFREVEALVQQLDQEQVDGGNSTRMVTLKNSNSAAVRQALTSILGANVTTTTTTAQDFNRNQGGDRGGDRAQSEDFARRMEFFRRMREASEQGGGGGPGGPGGFGGGDRGGDRGGRGGGDRGGDRGGRGR